MPGPRHNERTKMTVVLASDMTSTKAVAEATGIARSTIIEWRKDPKYDTFRHNAREAMAEEATLVARMVWKKIAERIDEYEPRELTPLAEMATKNALLLNGDATARSENRDITGTISDAELVAAIREADRIASGAGVEEAPADEAQGER